MTIRISRLLTLIPLIVSILLTPSALTAATKQPTTKKIHTKQVKKTKHRAKGKTSGIPTLPPTTDVKTGIDQILSKANNLNIGVMIQTVDNGKNIYQYNADRHFTPASTMKLMTAAATLSYLGPNYVFQTQFLTNGQISNGVLNGNLYVKFSGDPELTLSELDAMVAILDHQGIRQIQGNLIIDDTDMDRENMAAGWLPNEQILPYAAPSNAIIINRNYFGFNIIASNKNGDPLQIKTDPNLANIKIINQGITSNARGACGLQVKVYGNNTGSNAYLLTGCMRPKKTLGVGVALNDTRAAGTSIMRYLLQQYCITVTGNVLYQKTPSNLKILAEHNSRPLSALITKMLKKSDNLIAGSLLKKLGSTYYNTMGTWKNGSQAMRTLLTTKAGIDFRGSINLDGSGLSRFNSISPIQLAKLLQYTYRMPFNNVFYQALPISGIDGTLRGRLGGPTLGKVRAKTGTEDGTSGLAGYVHTVNHQTLIFAILVNNPYGKGSQGTYRYLEDRIVQFLALHAPFGLQPNIIKPAPATKPLGPSSQASAE